jgi:hypothetical protein
VYPSRTLNAEGFAGLRPLCSTTAPRNVAAVEDVHRRVIGERPLIACRTREGFILSGIADPDGSGVNDVPEMKGYRVRLRVVEEYDVALLARSAVDAKARAEADVRGGEQFEAIQDSWPEEIVSVEALAAEPYPDLE